MGRQRPGGRTVRGMDAAAEPPRVRALLARHASQAPERTAASGWAGPRRGFTASCTVRPPAPPDTRQAQRFPHYTPIQKNLLIGMKLVVSYLSLMDRPLDERTVLQMQLSSGLLYAGRQWQRLADSRLGSYGISTACTMPLLMIGRSGGGIRQVALAQQLGMEGPSLVRLLDKLCASDLVRRERRQRPPRQPAVADRRGPCAGQRAGRPVDRPAPGRVRRAFHG